MLEVKINPDNKVFWENCKKKKLVFQKCKNCGKVRWPYSIACPECHSFEIEYINSKGEGKVYTYTVFHIPFHPDFKDKVPYIVAIIELDEGVRFLSNIVNSNPDELECEKRVKVYWEKFNEYFVPKFELIE